MNRRLQKTLVRYLLIPTLVSVFFVCPSWSQVGFQAGLESYPFFISGYEETSDKYSAALYPLTYPVLSPKMRRIPRATSATFASNSISFSTDYYQLGGLRKSLIPLSVDAHDFMNYRIKKSERSKFADLFTGAITSPDEQKRRRGLGISVALPKRLDKIFGEGGAGLQVSGYRRITFSGRSQWNDQANTDVFRQSKFPSLNMEQISKFEITGTIGTKISVRVSQDSQTDIPLENRIQIRYKGDDDDILKAIEAGNTNLNLPNTQFVGYSQRIQGLFGLKTVAQVGNLTLTGIMSQEKGSAESASFRASGESAEYIRDYEYIRNRMFDLFYLDELPEFFDVSAGDSIKVLYLYEQIRDTETDEIALGYPAQYYVFPDEDRRGEYAGESEQVTVREIEADQYEYEDDPVTGLPRVVFRSSRSPSRSIAFYMEIIKGAAPDSVVKIGNISQTDSDTLFLKLLSLNSGGADPTKKSWDLMWRNCYSMPRGVTGQDLDLKILKGLSGTEQSTTQDNLEYQDSEGGNENYIQVLGLDQTNTTNIAGADGRLDDHKSEVFRSDWGLLIFPHREPFDNDTTFAKARALEVRVSEIYNSRQQSSIASASQYYIQISSRSRSSIIRLNRANIIEGSERVMLNGRQLSRGIDYNIMYDFGQVTLLSQDALDPNAELSIDFEYAPFLSLQKKTLLGTRLQYDFSDNIKFGSTFLYKSDKAEDRKPRVGQETATMLVMDFDASLRLKPSFLTTVANALPLVTTDVPSNLIITGEVAQSRPNPNVDDVAYVDDFESALNQLSIGTLRSNWNLASPPYLDTTIDTSVYYRGSLLWHNPDLSGEIRQVEDVYDREARQGEGILRTFRMIFTPVIGITRSTVFDTLGQEVEVEDTAFLPSYGGITRYFHSRVDGEKVRLFEFRAQISDNSSATLHFDFGQISEDLYYHNEELPNANRIESPFSEDGYATGQPNGVVDNTEDVGLDGIPNQLEEGYDKDTLPDPSRDNWYFEGEGSCPLSDSLCNLYDDPDHPIWRNPATRYLWLNGTEGNLRDNAVPDQERLSDNGFKEINAYYSFDVPLANNEFEVEGSEQNGWKTYRIPVRDTTLSEILSEDGIEASWSQITHIRVWFSDSAAEAPTSIEIADWYFVQSNWEDTIILDPLSAQFDENGSKLTVASVSTEDNTFSPPPGVEAYRDPTYNVVEPQRGLLLDFESLQFQDTAMATKELITVDKYSGYRKMRMYVSLEELNETDSLLFFMRIGRDQKNYYEHRDMISVTYSWDPNQYVEIDFNDLTALKDEALRDSTVRLNEIDITKGKYRVVGNPNLNEIRMFSVGVVNTDTTLAGRFSEVSGRIWLDELRVTDVRKDVGTAGRINTNGTIADLLSYNFGFSSKDPYFRSISAATRGGSNNNLGSGQTETSSNYGVTFNLHKLLPRSWGANLPISYNERNSTKTPLLRTNTDIVLPEEIRELEKSTNTSRSISVNGVRFNHTGRNPLFSLFLNRIQGTSFSYGRTKSHDVRTPYRLGENMSVQSGFDFGVKQPPSLPVFFWTKYIPIARKTSNSRLYFYPSTWKVKANYQRSLTIQDNANKQRLTTISRTLTASLDLNYKIFDNLTTGYRYSTTRDLTDLYLVRFKLKDPKIGLETRYQQSFSGSYDPKLLQFLTSAFSYRAGYTEDYDRTYDAYRSTLTQSHSVNGVFDHKKLLGAGGSTERRFRGRANIRGGGANKENDAGSGGRFYDIPLRVLRGMIGWIQPFSYKYEESFKNSLPGIQERPYWRYRFGLTREPMITKFADQNRSPLSTESQNYSLSSGFVLLGGIKTDVAFRRTISTDLVTQGVRYENTSTSWPDLSIRIQPFRTLPIIKPVVNKLIDIFSPRTGFTRQSREKFNLDGSFVTESSTSTSLSPLISLTLKLHRSLQVTGAYTVLRDKSFRYNQTSGDFTSETRTLKKTIAASTKYSFSAPGGIGLPFLGRLKFKSTMSVEVNVKVNSDLSETANKGKEFVANSDKSDISISPRISYQFSSKIKGGVTGRWQDSVDERRAITNHIRELQIWTEITF